MIAARPAPVCPSNPFCTRFVRPGQLEYQFADGRGDQDSYDRFQQLVACLEQHRAGLIVGPHGSGKSTLLRSLDRWLGDAFDEIARVQLSASPSATWLEGLKHSRRSTLAVLDQQARLGEGGLLIVDGMEQLWRPDRARLLRKMSRRNQTLLATSHAPLSGLTILYRTSVNGELVRSLTRILLAGTSPTIKNIVDGELQRRDWSRLTDVRELWFELYDNVQPQIVQSQIASSQYSLPRNLRDARSLVCHHGSYRIAKSGERMDG